MPPEEFTDVVLMVDAFAEAQGTPDPVLFQNSAEPERLKYQRLSAASPRAFSADPEGFGLALSGKGR